MLNEVRVEPSSSEDQRLIDRYYHDATFAALVEELIKIRQLKFVTNKDLKEAVELIIHLGK